MATRNISPRADGEGSLGRSGKKWGNIYADNGHIAGRNIAEDGAKLDAQATAIEQIRVSVGTPLVANSALDMTDINKIYVYTGNETGYTKGDWYYYDGTAWVSGGVYNSTAFETDKTLTIANEAADAKATGDWLRDIAVPVTALPEIPETAVADEYMKVVVDKDNRVLYGVKRDGSFYWQKGVPQHVIDACNPTIENDEYMYVMLDSEGHVLYGVKRDGTFTWQKGVPKHVQDKINELAAPTIDNDEYMYVMLDSEGHVLFGVKRDGSFDWQKGLPKPVREKLEGVAQTVIQSEGFIQLTQDSEGKLIEGVLSDGTKKFMSPVSFGNNVQFGAKNLQSIGEALSAINPSLFYYKPYIKTSEGSGRFITGLDVLYLEGDTTAMTKDDKVNLAYRFRKQIGTCTCKWQGASSISFPKKNYTIAKLNPAIDVGWGTQNKYVLKADFSDASRVRNVVSAKLWGGVVKSRTPVNERLSALPNGGAIDGFPIMLVINGEYQGIYNFNIPKDGWMLGMSGSATEAIFNSEGGDFKTTVTKEEVLNAQKWEIAYLPDEDNPDWAIDSLNRMLQATINSTGANYRDTLEDYLDIESAIDYFIYCALLDNSDGVVKNFLLGTYDGVKWFFVAYDLDWTFGSHSWGTAYFSPQTVSFASLQGRNRAFHLIYRYDTEALKARYAELRNGALSEDNVLTTLSGYLAQIPKSIIDEDYRLWPTTPGTLINNFDQIMQWYRLRIQYMDEEIANM